LRADKDRGVTDRHPAPSDPGTAFFLGKIEGQLRELIHNQNNEAMKNAAIGEKVSKLEGVPDDIAEIKQRLTALETAEHRREGATGVFQAILRSPTIAWLVAAAGLVWVAFKERLDL
jgi:hypothetical protein